MCRCPGQQHAQLSLSFRVHCLTRNPLANKAGSLERKWQPPTLTISTIIMFVTIPHLSLILSVSLLLPFLLQIHTNTVIVKDESPKTPLSEVLENINSYSVQK